MICSSCSRDVGIWYPVGYQVFCTSCRYARDRMAQAAVAFGVLGLIVAVAKTAVNRAALDWLLENG